MLYQLWLIFIIFAPIIVLFLAIKYSLPREIKLRTFWSHSIKVNPEEEIKNSKEQIQRFENEGAVIEKIRLELKIEELNFFLSKDFNRILVIVSLFFAAVPTFMTLGLTIQSSNNEITNLRSNIKVVRTTADELNNLALELKKIKSDAVQKIYVRLRKEIIALQTADLDPNKIFAIASEIDQISLEVETIKELSEHQRNDYKNWLHANATYLESGFSSSTYKIINNINKQVFSELAGVLSISLVVYYLLFVVFIEGIDADLKRACLRRKKILEFQIKLLEKQT